MYMSYVSIIVILIHCFLFQGILKLYKDILLNMDFIHLAQFLTRLPDTMSVHQLFTCIESVSMQVDKKRFQQVFNNNKESNESKEWEPAFPAHVRRWSNVVLMLGQRRRHWPNNKSSLALPVCLMRTQISSKHETLGQHCRCLIFTGLGLVLA